MRKLFRVLRDKDRKFEKEWFSYKEKSRKFIMDLIGVSEDEHRE